MEQHKVTKEQADIILTARKNGATYNDIRKQYNVSAWWCIQHLRGVERDRSWVEERWKLAEKEAEIILKDKSFTHIVNLNEVCPSPYWDYYAEKDGERWLFDVTINQSKNLVEKGLRAVNGYKSAVLLKDGDKWSLLEIVVKQL